MSSSATAPLPGGRAPIGARVGALGRMTESPLLRFIGRRLAIAILVLLGGTFLAFLVVSHLPGNAAQELLGVNATPAEIHQLSVKLGVDQPFFTRYFDWLGGIFSGSLGHSLASGQSGTSI